MAKKVSPANQVAMDSPQKFVPAEKRKSGWDDYEIRGALETLSKAIDVRKNKPLMAACQKEADRQLAASKEKAAKIKGAK